MLRNFSKEWKLLNTSRMKMRRWRKAASQAPTGQAYEVFEVKEDSEALFKCDFRKGAPFHVLYM